MPDEDWNIVKNKEDTTKTNFLMELMLITRPLGLKHKSDAKWKKPAHGPSLNRYGTSYTYSIFTLTEKVRHSL